jgi:hypothetical protein
VIHHEDESTDLKINPDIPQLIATSASDHRGGWRVRFGPKADIVRGTTQQKTPVL